VRDILLEARTQLAHARMAAGWLDGQVWEYLGHLDVATSNVANSPADVALLESQGEFFRAALQPALANAIVLSVFSLLEQALQRVCERHAAYNRDQGAWSRTPGSGVVRAVEYLKHVCSTEFSQSRMLNDIDDLRLIRNHMAHRGADFRSAPRGTSEAAKRHRILREDGAADPGKILAWMFALQSDLLDKLEQDLAR
jgi:hypothetical protein